MSAIGADYSVLVWCCPTFTSHRPSVLVVRPALCSPAHCAPVKHPPSSAVSLSSGCRIQSCLVRWVGRQGQCGRRWSSPSRAHWHSGAPEQAQRYDPRQRVCNGVVCNGVPTQGRPLTAILLGVVTSVRTVSPRVWSCVRLCVSSNSCLR